MTIKKTDFLGWIALGMLGGVALGLWGASTGWRSDSVRTGHAEWYLEGDTAEWRWKECPECKGIER